MMQYGKCFRNKQAFVVIHMAHVSYREKDFRIIKDMKHEINYKIGFEDSEILSYSRESDEITVRLKTWNESIIHIQFSEAIGLCDYGIGDVSEFVKEDNLTEFKIKVFQNNYETPPIKSEFFLYQFLNLEDVTSLEIVAKSYFITD